MERLTGIGVSPGVAIGRAVVLTQPTEVVRFPVAADRVDREVASIDLARDRSRQQLHGHPRAPGHRPGARPRAAVRRAAPDARRPAARRPGATDRARRTRQRGVGAAPGVRGPAAPLPLDGGSVSARAGDRHRRRRRTAADESPARGRPSRSAEGHRGPLGPGRRRADAVARRAAGLDARAWLRGRCRQPHVSHGDSGALAARARRRRPARPVGARHGRDHAHPRRHDRRSAHRAGARRGQGRRTRLVAAAPPCCRSPPRANR